MNDRAWIARVGDGRLLGLMFAAAAAVLVSGCTAESLRIAVEAQRRADQVQQTVFERQHEGLRILLFRDLLARLRAGGAFSAAQAAALNAAWNERDLIEFWCIQQERAKALRSAGVDAKLWSDQSVVDLLARSLSAKLGRLEDVVAAEAGRRAGAPAEAIKVSDER